MDYCILVDYGRDSGRMRFIVWDYRENKPAIKSLCAHGYGKGSTARTPVFSNEYGSYCSCSGHFRVGKEKTMSKPKGRKAIILYGQDPTNSNALQRGILIHAVRHMPNFPVYPFLPPVKVHSLIGNHKIRPMSEDCITIPFKQYDKLTEILESAEKPLLLCSYQS